MLKFNSRKEIIELANGNEKFIWTDEPDRIEVVNYGIFYLNDDKYPKYFKYAEPWDSHCCGTWHEHSKEEYIDSLKKKIAEHKKEIEELEEALAAE